MIVFRFVWMVFFLFIGNGYGYTNTSKEKKINIIFRFDACNALSPLWLEKEIIRIFGENGIRLTFAVIPFVCNGDVHDPSIKEFVPLSEEKKHILKDAVNRNIIDVALHGYSHKTFRKEYYSEFLGESFENQLRKINQGKNFLEKAIEKPIKIFVPPWNSYDANTLDILEMENFKVLSSNRIQYVELESKLKFLPFTCQIPELEKAIEVAKRFSKMESPIVVIFCHYDFKDFNPRGHISLKGFEELISKLRKRKDLRLLSIGQAVDFIENLSPERYRENKWNYILQKYLPPFLQDESAIYLYEESPNLYMTMVKVAAFYLFILFTSVFFTYFFFLYLFRKSPVLGRFGSVTMILFSMILVLYVWRDLKVSLRDMVVIIGVSGMLFGLMLLYVGPMKKSRI